MLKDKDKLRINHLIAAPIPMSAASERDGFEATTWNESWYTTFLYTPEETEDRVENQIGLWVTPQERKRFIDLVKTRNHVTGFRALLRRGDGVIRTCDLNGQLFGSIGKRKLILVYLDITERVMSVDALIESEERFSKIFRSLPTPMTISDIKSGLITDANDRFLQMIEFSTEQCLDKTSLELGIWREPEQRTRHAKEIQKTGSIKEVPIEFVTGSGEVRFLLWSAEVISLAGYEVMLSHFFDFTDRKRTEDALRESESYNKVLFSDSLVPLALLDPKTARFIDGNNAAIRLLGFTDYAQFSRKTPLDVSTAYQYDGKPSEISLKEHLQLTQVKGSHEFEWRYRRPDNTTWDAEVRSMSFFLQDKRLIQLSLQDISNRKKTEQSLRNSKERFSKAFRLSPAPIAITAIRTGRILDANEEWLRLTDYSLDEVVDHTTDELGIWHNKSQRERMIEQILSNGSVKDMLCQFVTKGGNVIDVLVSAEIISLSGKTALLSLGYDYTEKKKLEAQLLQSQKMESVGRLAGGLAHDYNNMLGVIIGHTELAILKLGEHERKLCHFDKILDAAKRSSELTKQLLTYARRHPISPKAMDVNAAITSTLQMLQVIIGEDIALNWHPGPEAGQVKMDQSQFDQLLINLCVNARDAIEGVGKIIIETQRAVIDDTSCLAKPCFIPGDYSVVIVSDDGSGMDQATQLKIFEPFFTTKGVGHGTGLGLVTVYGIIKHNKGFVNVYSELGRGTTFKIYLPRFVGLVVDSKAREDALVLSRNGETVLVAEDEKILLEITAMMLTKLGYRVLAAGTPAEAIRMSVAHAGTIDLLMTDVVMPEMHGRELERHIMESNPQARCLFTSGYTTEVITHNGVLDENVNFIQKPFTFNDLALKIGECLR